MGGSEWIKVGPMGGDGGNASDMNITPERIVHMKFYYTSNVVYGFDVTYIKNGNQHTRYFGGVQQGRQTKEITLAEDEYINSMSGYFSRTYYTHIVIAQLTISTNKGQRIDVATPQSGSYFNLTMDENTKILGFFGRAGDVLDAIGAICLVTY